MFFPLGPSPTFTVSFWVSFIYIVGNVFLDLRIIVTFIKEQAVFYFILTKDLFSL